MNSDEDVQLHELESIERNLSTDEVESDGAGDCFLITSASGFLITSASGFLIT
jgi:hypothetical protein